MFFESTFSFLTVFQIYYLKDMTKMHKTKWWGAVINFSEDSISTLLRVDLFLLRKFYL